MVQKKLAMLAVLVFAVVALMSSCDKSFNEPMAPVETTEQLQDEDVSSPELRASNITYYSTPGVGETVPNSTVNIKGKGTATYHGGVLAAKVLRQNGNKFTIRIFKQDGGAFTGGGLAMIISQSPDGGDLAGHKSYYPGDTHVDIEITANFDKGAVHFYPSTIASPSRYRYYAEPILIYTSPMYTMKSSYTRYESLGALNGVVVKASNTDLLESDILSVQCTEYCHRYYSQVYGKNIVNTGVNGGHAATWYGSAKAKGLTAYRNGGAVAPRPGDILCMSGGSSKRGHVAIIMEVTDSYVKIAQQNAGIPGDEWQHAIGGELSYNPSTRTISRPDGYRIQGWLRVPLN